MDSIIRDFNPLIGLLIGTAYIVIDAMYAKYTLEVAELNERKAATTGTLIHFLMAIGVINYTQNWLYIFPLAIGSWIGTFYMVRKTRMAKQNKP